jgi:hypothetical protein
MGKKWKKHKVLLSVDGSDLGHCPSDRQQKCTRIPYVES